MCLDNKETIIIKGGGGGDGLMDKVSASQPRDHDHDSSYDTITGWFQEADSRVINISC